MKNRFEVSTEGMRLLHDGRPLWQLVKELIANCWDEKITECKVYINKLHRGVIQIIVEDDGNGFSDITDAYTLMSPTPKRSNANVRGRFNIGEKELLSIARDATIETVGHTVEFPIGGGRKIKRNKREQGTRILVTVKGKQNEIAETHEMLKNFIPPVNVEYIVGSNFNEVHSIVERRNSIVQTKAVLPTVKAVSIKEPIRNISQETKIDVYDPKCEKGAIYEMGIFIQYHDMPFDVDINQKVPLPPNRDVVSNAYLQDIYAEVLAVTTDRLTEDNVSESWVQIAVEDKKRTSDETVQAVFDLKIGDKTVMSNPFDAQANEDAHLAGYDLIRPQSLSTEERSRFQDIGLETSTARFGRERQDIGADPKPVKVTEDMENVASYAKWLSMAFFGFACEVRFIRNEQYPVQATYGGKMLTFNMGQLRRKWFVTNDGQPTVAQTELILHELAHEAHSEHPHAGSYVTSLANLGAKATHLALDGTYWIANK